MPKVEGTAFETNIIEVEDADTMIVEHPQSSGELAVRLLNIDSEESGEPPPSEEWDGDKPATKMGNRAKNFAKNYFDTSSPVTLEVPGTEDLGTALTMYRGNFGRLLAWAYQDDEDYQRVALEEGYAAYFVKYGYPVFESHHQRYRSAEQRAQVYRRGIWDQHVNNGRVMRDYPTLKAWWHWRAGAVQEYRDEAKGSEEVLSHRSDHDEILRKAENGEEVTVFSDFNDRMNPAGMKWVVGNGSPPGETPFAILVENTSDKELERIRRFMNTRVLGDTERQAPNELPDTVNNPGRGYLYVTGKTTVYRDKIPEVIVTSIDQLSEKAPL